MSEQNAQQNAGTIVGAKRVRKDEKDTKGREKFVLTFGPDSRGIDGAQALADAINSLVAEGKQINFDVRIGESTSANGRSFPTAFVIVKEMVPKDQASAQVTYAKKPSRQDSLKAKADKVRASIEG